MSDAVGVVREFIEACNANDLERILGFFAEDCVYHNMPVDPVRGRDAIRAVLASFMSAAQQVDWVVHHVARTADDAVLTERTDRFLVNGRWIELPVMGTFEVRGGRITAWRDYFDLAQFQRQMTAAAGGAPAA